MFNQAHLKEGDVVLITAAGSEVGRMVIHVGKLKGVKVPFSSFFPFLFLSFSFPFLFHTLNRFVSSLTFVPPKGDCVGEEGCPCG